MHKRWKIISILFLLSIIMLMTNCTRKKTPRSSTSETMSFEDFKNTIYRDPGKNGVYIVNGDIPVRNDEELRVYYNKYLNSSKMTVYSSIYQDPNYDHPNPDPNAQKYFVVWPETKRNAEGKIELTYCVSKKGFNDTSYDSGTPRYEEIVAEMTNAANTWENEIDVDFKHIIVEDGDENSELCTPDNTNVDFNVSPSAVNGQSRAFLPNFDRAHRQLIVARGTFYNDYISVKGALLHQLGHILGFRHEHIRNTTGGQCIEMIDWEALTSYGGESVMHFRNDICGYTVNTDPNGVKYKDYTLTDRDIKGARSVYGPDLVIPEATIDTLSNNDIVSSQKTITISAKDPFCINRKSYESAENGGIVEAKFYINGELVDTQTSLPGPCNIEIPEIKNFSYVWDTTVLNADSSPKYPDGSSVIINVVVKDKAGLTNDTILSKVTVVVNNDFPKVSEALPGDGDTTVAYDGFIKLQFSEPMMAGSINNTTIVVKQGAATVAGIVTFDEATNIAIFNPNGYFDQNTSYNVTITTGALDSTGLQTDHTFTFTTWMYSCRLDDAGADARENFKLGYSKLPPMLSTDPHAMQ